MSTILLWIVGDRTSLARNRTHYDHGTIAGYLGISLALVRIILYSKIKLLSQLLVTLA